MKKIISGLLVGLMATSFTMTTMAAPVQDHKQPPAQHHIDKKPQPPKHDMKRGPDHKAPLKHDMKRGSDHKAPLKHDIKDNHPEHKLPPKR